MSILYDNPLGSSSNFFLDDPIDGTPIPYLPYHLVAGGESSPQGTLGYETGSSMFVTYITASVTHMRFCYLILGINYRDSDGTQNRIMRTLPHRLPLEGRPGYIPGYPNMYAVRIQNISFIGGPDPIEYVSGSSGEKIRRPTFGFISNDSNAGDLLKYAYAKVTVEYQPLPYRVISDDITPYNKEWYRFAWAEHTPRTEFLNLNAGTLKWIDNPAVNPPAVVPSPVPVRDQSIDYIVHWRLVPFRYATLQDWVGTSNFNANYLSGCPGVPSGGFDVDEVMLVGYQETRIASPFRGYDQFDNNATDVTDSGFLFNYDFFYQYKANGHNAGLRRAADGLSVNYNTFSYTGSAPTAGLAGNSARAIKQYDHSLLWNPS